MESAPRRSGPSIELPATVNYLLVVFDGLPVIDRWHLTMFNGLPVVVISYPETFNVLPVVVISHAETFNALPVTEIGHPGMFRALPVSVNECQGINFCKFVWGNKRPSMQKEPPGRAAEQPAGIWR